LLSSWTSCIALVTPGVAPTWHALQGWKKLGLKKKPAQWFYLGFFGFIYFFLFFFLSFFGGVFFPKKLYICPEERIFRGFFQVKEYF
jgi:hypothetical protein